MSPRFVRVHSVRSLIPSAEAASRALRLIFGTMSGFVMRGIISHGPETTRGGPIKLFQTPIAGTTSDQIQ